MGIPLSVYKTTCKYGIEGKFGRDGGIEEPYWGPSV